MMELEHRQRIKQLYHAALACEPAARRAYLQHACAGDNALQQEVESLLAQCSAPENSLEAPAIELAAKALAEKQSSSLIGQQLGSSKILSLLGAGGMGEVYQAHDNTLGRDVAIKVLPAGFVHDPDRLARFQREARMLAALNHPNIATIHGLDQSSGTHYLVMELVPGESLAEKLKSGALAEKEVAALGGQIAEALEEAHEHQVVHRDLKPANVMVTPKGRVKVLDFGVARLLRPRDETVHTLSVSETQGVAGTLPYMAPEQLLGEAADARTDLWALGAVLYEAAIGRKPFDEQLSSRLIDSILHRSPVAPREVNGRLSPELERIILKCLEKSPEDRYQSAKEIAVDLRRIGTSSVAVAKPARPRRGWPRWQVVAVAAAALAILAGGVRLFYSRNPSMPVTSPAEYTQITNFTDAAMAPSLSPDGRMVTFKRGINAAQAGAVEDFLGAGQIYVKLLPNGESVQLTNERGPKYGPVFTADGSRVAYTQVTLSGASISWDTWTVPVLGGQPTRLLPNASGLSWIGSQRVLFSEITTGLHMGIVTATEARADERTIYFPPLELGMAHYSYASPDRKSILVVEMANTHAFDSPCRLVPFDGSSAGRPVGPSGACLSAAWSPDGKWMYFAADVGGNVHLWRQKFPNGSPEQITFGTNQEQGIVLAPDGRSLITSIGRRLSSIWIHDAAGEHAITSEGYASAPRLSADGKRAFYVDSGTSSGFNPAGPAPAGELRTVELASGKTESVLPGMSVADYDISPDGREVAFTIPDSGGESQIWLAPTDRRSAPRQMARSADQVSFGPNGELFFRSKEKKVNFLYRMNRDGSGRERITSTPVLIKYDVSPGGEWVTAAVPEAGDNKESSETVPVPMETVAIPVHGGPLRRICGATCVSRWSSDGRFFYAALGGQTRVIPVPAGKSFPDLPVSGMSVENKPDELHGARDIQHSGVFLGPDPSTYVFRRTELQANLFRIPLH